MPILTTHLLQDVIHIAQQAHCRRFRSNRRKRAVDFEPEF